MIPTKENETTVEKYQAMTRWDRAEWVKQEVIKSIAAGQDIKTPIFKAIFMEELRYNETLQTTGEK